MVWLAISAVWLDVSLSPVLDIVTASYQISDFSHGVMTIGAEIYCGVWLSVLLVLVLCSITKPGVSLNCTSTTPPTPSLAHTHHSSFPELNQNVQELIR